jgi:hypothetical protein
MANVQGAAFCVTVKVCPLTVMVPVRWVVLGLTATLKLTVPFPEPPGTPVTVNHPALLDAVHEHEDGVVTAKEPGPPPAATDWLVGESA